MKRKTHLQWRIAQSALLVTLGIGFPSLSAAHEFKLGVVDVERVVLDAKSVQAAIRSGREQLRERQEALAAKVRERELLRAKIKSRPSFLPPGAITAQQAEFNALEEEIGSLAEDVNKDMARVRDQVVRPQKERILEMVKEIGERQGFDLIVRSDVVLFNRNVTDVTPRVVQALEAAGANNVEQEDPPAVPLEELER